MHLLFKLLMISIILHQSNAASLLRLPLRIDEYLHVFNSSTISSPNSTDLSANSNRRFIDAVKETYDGITAGYPHAYLIGVRARVAGPGRWQHFRVFFTNIARAKDRGIVVSMGQNDQWKRPSIKNQDYAWGNKYMFRPALSLDIKNADDILRAKHPTAAYTEVYLYHPKKFHDFADQPYWIFVLEPRFIWAKYVFVWVYDWTVRRSNNLPESVT